MKQAARLLYGDAEHCADVRYALGAFVPDPIVLINAGEGWLALASELEIDRLRRTSSARIEEEARWRRQAKEMGLVPADAIAAAAAWLKEHRIAEVEVPGAFPLAAAERLRGWGLEVRACQGAFFPERRTKSDEEIQQIRRAERLAAQAMRQAERFLQATTIGARGELRMPDGRVARAETLRAVIDTFLVAHGAIAAHTIVACGRQSSDPHETGHGVLRAHAPIVIDIFPRLMDSGYWGDMTRTFCKGTPPAKLVAMHRAVAKAQRLALSMVRAGADGAAIHRAVQRYFDQAGFPTGVRRGRRFGFFHGTGHGVGLEIHEAPRISVQGDVLCEGDVVTIEPGLYDPSIGGVRIEDLVVVRKDGCENLTRYHRRLVVR